MPVEEPVLPRASMLKAGVGVIGGVRTGLTRDTPAPALVA